MPEFTFPCNIVVPEAPLTPVLILAVTVRVEKGILAAGMSKDPPEKMNLSEVVRAGVGFTAIITGSDR